MMTKVTINYAIGMILLGVGSYIGTDRVSWTALLPAIFGAVFLVLGLLAMKEHIRKHVMHAAAALALIVILGTVMGVVKTIQRLMGVEIEKPPAALVQAVTCVVTVAYLGLSVNSFIQARRARKAAEAKG